MATKPTVDIRWATVASTDPESGQPNVTEPPDSRKDNGWQRKERAPANWLNYLLNGIYQWILWAEEEIDGLTGAVGDYLEKAENLNDLANKPLARVNLGVEIGTDVQAYDAGLQSISSLTPTADQMLYATDSNVYATTTLTNFARTLLDDTDAASMRTTLGLGTMATQASTAVNIDGGTVDGVTIDASDITGGTIDGSAITSGTIDGAAITGGTIATLDTDLAVADGGTGASTAAGARTNLGVDNFVSTLQDIPDSTTPLTIPHGMGVIPTFFDVFLECIVSDRGYAVGDRTKGWWNQRSGLTAPSGGPFITADATNLYLYPGYQGEMPYVVNRTDSPDFNLSQVNQTGTEWQLRFVAKRN